MANAANDLEIIVAKGYFTNAMILAAGGILALIFGVVVILVAYRVLSNPTIADSIKSKGMLEIGPIKFTGRGVGAVLMLTSVAWGFLSYVSMPKVTIPGGATFESRLLALQEEFSLLEAENKSLAQSNQENRRFTESAIALMSINNAPPNQLGDIDWTKKLDVERFVTGALPKGIDTQKAEIITFLMAHPPSQDGGDNPLIPFDILKVDGQGVNIGIRDRNGDDAGSEKDLEKKE